MKWDVTLYDLVKSSIGKMGTFELSIFNANLAMLWFGIVSDGETAQSRSVFK